MDWIDERLERLSDVEKCRLIALAAACGSRALLVYEYQWVGNYSSAVKEAVDLGWQAACGASLDAEVLAARAGEVRENVLFFAEEDLEPVGSATTVVLRVLETALAVDPRDAALAVARALGSALFVARLVDAEVAGRNHAKPGPAEAEESEWQDAAIERVRSQAEISRTMFDDLGPTPPAWWAPYAKVLKAKGWSVD